MARYETGMCGIAAIFAYRTNAPGVMVDELEKINQAMIRRGPDGGGYWISDDGRIGLAHRRLAIIDLEPRANQPLVVDQRYWITFNGEIYNYRALRTVLMDKGVVFTTESDTEVLLRLYECEGAEMVHKLRGMFALVIWDSVERQLFLARDAFGVKPLYFSDDGATVRAASTVKALRAGGHAGDGGPDPAGHVGFFLFGSVPEPHTLYADIEALPAGHTLTIGANGRHRLVKYFSPRDILTAPRDGTVRVDLRHQLLDSVQHHLVADVPVGVFLSAGLDSASITALASESQQGDLRTFTLGFEEFSNSKCDEVPLAELIAKRYKTTPKIERVAKLHFDRALPDIILSMDQPTIDGVNTYFVARAAARSGLKVALSGLGGDEMFAGYDTFRRVPSLARWLGWIPGLSTLGKGFRIVAAPLMGSMMVPKYASLFEYGGSASGAYLLGRGLFLPWELPKLIDPDLAAEGWRQLRPLVRLENAIAGIASAENQVRILEMCFYMRNQLLRDADWAGMAHSLEIRVPLVDMTLFKALAPLLGTGISPTKKDMAATPLRALPSEVCNKPKTGFFVPVERWLNQAGDGINDNRESSLRGWAKRVYKAQIAA